MHPAGSFLRATELDRTNFPELRDRVLAAEQEGPAPEPRSYPGYPRWPLVRVRPRLWPPLDRALLARRSVRVLETALPSRRVLSRVLLLAHGCHAAGGRGPVPSAGGLQALELYLATFAPSWLPAGLYHYDRAGHHLSQVAAGNDRGRWEDRVPSLTHVAGGALMWVVVGDTARTAAGYGERGDRFLLLEAGHLLQNLCLLSASLGLATVPLGGCFDRDVARLFRLPPTDAVLYLGMCGRVRVRRGGRTAGARRDGGAS